MAIPTSMNTTQPHAYHVPDLRPLLAPHAIAIVGASDRPGAGPNVLGNLKRLEFPGQVYPVNPKYTELGDWRCYPSLADLPGPIDTVAILLGYKHVLPTLQQAQAIGCKAAWVLASGFGEAGPEGEAAQQELVAYARANDFAVCGPNCVGIVNLHAQAATYSVALPATLRRGHVGAVLQSGAVCLGIANSNRGLGFSTLISSGNEAVLDNADYIAYLADDPDTKVIIAFIEGFKSPDKFIWAAERARAAGKPLLVVKVGRSEVAQRATMAHTGSLAGADAVHDAVFRKHGVVRLDSLDELLETAELFLKAPPPAGRGVALLTLSGGQIGLIGDQMQGLDLHLPALSEAGVAALAQVLPPYSALANPLDAWGAGNFDETYPACMRILAAEPEVHVVAVARDTSPGVAEPEIRQSNVIVDAAAEVAAASGKPVLVFSNIANGIEPTVKARADAAGLPLLQGTRASLRAIEALIRYADARRGVSPVPAASPVSAAELADLKHWLADQPPNLTEQAGKRLLAAYGIPITREATAASADEAVRLAAGFCGPVALKINSPDILHKTEAKGVLLNVTGADAIRQGFAQLLNNAWAYKPDARIEGVLVQEMVPPGAVEVIIGASVDPQFGPAVVFGLGGVLVELFRDASLRLAPATRAEALDMIGDTRGAALLRGYRGRTAADVEALAAAICRLSHLASDFRNEIAAIDVNPLMILPVGQGVVAADALVIKR
jgi:acyl-CoA synthetase (NDP forming)